MEQVPKLGIQNLFQQRQRKRQQFSTNQSKTHRSTNSIENKLLQKQREADSRINKLRAEKQAQELLKCKSQPEINKISQQIGKGMKYGGGKVLRSTRDDDSYIDQIIVPKRAFIRLKDLQVGFDTQNTTTSKNLSHSQSNVNYMIERYRMQRIRQEKENNETFFSNESRLDRVRRKARARFPDAEPEDPLDFLDMDVI